MLEKISHLPITGFQEGQRVPEGTKPFELAEVVIGVINGDGDTKRVPIPNVLVLGRSEKGDVQHLNPYGRTAHVIDRFDWVDYTAYLG
ncbi:hypothetical protein HYX07_00030 [Candidatus Woesearchaeota archaeon]|nr:hypothetical protein [Candidatus Woesearchaeota archaeon]